MPGDIISLYPSGIAREVGNIRDVYRGARYAATLGSVALGTGYNYIKRQRLDYGGNEKWDRDGNKTESYQSGYKSRGNLDQSKYVYKKAGQDNVNTWQSPAFYKEAKMANYRKFGRKKYGRKYKKAGRSFYRRRQPAMVQRNLLSTGLGFPKMMKMTHKWTTRYDVGASAAINQFQYSANGAYDPDPGAGVSKPINFVAMAALYDHYLVVGSKIKVTPVVTAGTTNVEWGIYMNDDNSYSPSSLDLCKQQQSSTYKLLTAGSDPRFTSITKKYSAKKTFGGAVMSNDEIGAQSGANPVEQTWYSIFCQGALGVSTTISFIVEIDYIIVWKENKDLAA